VVVEALPSLVRQAVAVEGVPAEAGLAVEALVLQDKALLVEADQTTEVLEQQAAQAAVVAQAKQELQAKPALAAKAAMDCWCQ
jgi:hypothetical protein